MITITRRLEIDAGHRLMNHESKCRSAHGHRYMFDVEVSAPELDEVGRVIDFGVIKTVLGGWLDDNWDHAFIYEEGDPVGVWLEDNGQKRFMVGGPPTAENLAQLFLVTARSLLSPVQITVLSVRLWETPNCSALAT